METRLKKALANKKREEFLKGNIVKGVHDELLIHREVYNPHKFDLIFTRNVKMDAYIIENKIPLGHDVVICKPDDFAYLPHGYYICKGRGVPRGEQLWCITNFGDEMFKGNKKVSLPAL